jgi:aminopeptidase N
MVIGATDFAIGTVTPCARGGRNSVRADECVPVTYWSYPADSAKAAMQFRRAGQMLEYYASRFGAFPYEKLAHVQSSTRYGGMENVGAIFYSERAIAQNQLGETTIAHETAHQWFGDAVTETHWNHLWLSEGFATYFGVQFFESADGVAKFRELITNAANQYMSSDVTDLAIVDTTAVPGNDLFALLNANSYQKGGMVLHMLRGLLGDNAFFTGIRRYVERHLNGTALTADLQRELEQASNQDLGWFFQQWVYQPGYPIYRISHTWDSAAKQLVLTVEQTQKAAWPAFRMPVEFAFDTPEGEIRRKLEVSGRRAVLRVDLPAAPTRVRFDPGRWLLARVEGS